MPLAGRRTPRIHLYVTPGLPAGDSTDAAHHEACPDVRRELIPSRSWIAGCDSLRTITLLRIELSG